MRVIVQRVSQASLTIDGEAAGEIGVGLVVLAGFRDADATADLEWAANKVIGLRVFPDEQGNLNRALDEVEGGLLVVPNFTLYGDCRKGRRPSFTEAARPEIASPLYDRWVTLLASGGRRLVCGRFGAHMHVSLTNDGPVTLILERETTDGPNSKSSHGDAGATT